MRPLPLMLLSCLLLGCANQPADEVSQPASAAKPAIQAVQTAAKNMHNQRQLSGTLMTPPAGSRVELAVLLIDAQGYPRKLLGSGALTGTGQALPFTVVFARPAATSDLQLQLRARVTLSGQLVQRLPGKLIPPAQHDDLGNLQLIPAP